MICGRERGIEFPTKPTAFSAAPPFLRLQSTLFFTKSNGVVVALLRNGIVDGERDGLNRTREKTN